MPVNICRNVPFLHVAVDLDIDRMLQIILEDQIQISACHGGIIGQRHVGNGKSVIITLHDLDLRPKKRIIKSRGHLADTAAHALYDFIVNKYAREGIPVVLFYRINAVIGRNLFSRINDLPVHQLGGTGNILIPALITETELRGIGSQQIRNIGQLLGLFAAALHNRKRNIHRSVVPSVGDSRLDRLTCLLGVQTHTGISGNYRHPGFALLDQLCICGTVEDLGKNTVHHAFYIGAADGPVDPDICGLGGMLFPVPLQRGSGIAVAHRLAKCGLHVSVHTQISECGFHVAIFTCQGDLHLGEFLLPLFQLCTGSVLSESSHRQSVHRDIIPDLLFRRFGMGRHRNVSQQKSQHQKQRRIDLPSSFLHVPHLLSLKELHFISLPKVRSPFLQPAEHRSHLR